MASKSNNDHLDAFNEIVSCLSKFDEETQRHILNSVYNWFRFSDSPQAIKSAAAIDEIEDTTEPTSFQGFSGGADQSPKEFLMEKAPETNVERVACLAYYLTHYRGTPNFKTFDISKLNTEAAQPKFANPTVAVNDAARAQLIVPSTKGAKQLSAMGEQFVLALPNRFEAKEVLKMMKSKRRSKAKVKKKTASTTGK